MADKPDNLTDMITECLLSSMCTLYIQRKGEDTYTDIAYGSLSYCVTTLCEEVKLRSKLFTRLAPITRYRITLDDKPILAGDL